MQVTITFLSLFKALAGVDQDTMEVAEGTTIGQLCQTLGQKYTGLPFESEHTYCMINDKVSKQDHVLQENDEVWIFQLLAGG
jgi:molybdopterin converting factor small subunit